MLFNNAILATILATKAIVAVPNSQAMGTTFVTSILPRSQDRGSKHFKALSSVMGAAPRGEFITAGHESAKHTATRMVKPVVEVVEVIKVDVASTVTAAANGPTATFAWDVDYQYAQPSSTSGTVATHSPSRTTSDGSMVTVTMTKAPTAQSPSKTGAVATNIPSHATSDGSMNIVTMTQAPTVQSPSKTGAVATKTPSHASPNGPMNTVTMNENDQTTKPVSMSGFVTSKYPKPTAPTKTATLEGSNQSTQPSSTTAAASTETPFRIVPASEVDVPILGNAMASLALKSWGPMPTSIDDCVKNQTSSDTTTTDADQDDQDDQNRSVNCAALEEMENWQFMECDDDCRRAIAIIVPSVVFGTGVSGGILPMLIKNRDKFTPEQAKAVVDRLAEYLVSIRQRLRGLRSVESSSDSASEMEAFQKAKAEISKAMPFEVPAKGERFPSIRRRPKRPSFKRPRLADIPEDGVPNFPYRPYYGIPEINIPDTPEDPEGAQMRWLDYEFQDEILASAIKLPLGVFPTIDGVLAGAGYAAPLVAYSMGQGLIHAAVDNWLGWPSNWDSSSSDGDIHVPTSNRNHQIHYLERFSKASSKARLQIEQAQKAIEEAKWYRPDQKWRAEKQLQEAEEEFEDIEARIVEMHQANQRVLETQERAKDLRRRRGFNADATRNAEEQVEIAKEALQRMKDEESQRLPAISEGTDPLEDLHKLRDESARARQKVEEYQKAIRNSKWPRERQIAEDRLRRATQALESAEARTEALQEAISNEASAELQLEDIREQGQGGEAEEDAETLLEAARQHLSDLQDEEAMRRPSTPAQVEAEPTVQPAHSEPSAPPSQENYSGSAGSAPQTAEPSQPRNSATSAPKPTAPPAQENYSASAGSAPQTAQPSLPRISATSAPKPTASPSQAKHSASTVSTPLTTAPPTTAKPDPPVITITSYTMVPSTTITITPSPTATRTILVQPSAAAVMEFSGKKFTLFGRGFAQNPKTRKNLMKRLSKCSRIKDWRFYNRGQEPRNLHLNLALNGWDFYYAGKMKKVKVGCLNEAIREAGGPRNAIQKD